MESGHSLANRLGFSGSLREAIEERLAGAHLGSPIDIQQGEMPEDIIVFHLNAHGSSDELNDLIEVLRNIVRQWFDRLHHAIPELPDVERQTIIVLSALGRLTAKTGQPRVGNRLSVWLPQLWDKAITNLKWKPVYSAWVRAAIALGYSEHHVWDCALAYITNLENPEFAFEIATADPGYFFSTMLRRIVDANIDHADFRHDLAKLVTVATVALEGRKKLSARLLKEWDVLGAQVEVWATSKKTRWAAEAVVRGVADGTLSSVLAVRLDRFYSTGRGKVHQHRWESETWNHHNEFFGGVDKHLAHIRGLGPITEFSVSANEMPYSQNAYFVLWQALAKRAQIDITLKPCGWDEVTKRLINKELDIAIYNNGAPVARDLVRVSPGILTYENYILLGSTSHMEHRTLQNADPSLAKYLLSPWRTKGRIVSENERQNLSTLLTGQTIGIVRNSDIDVVTRSALSRLGLQESDVHFLALSTDEGLERLLDGKIAFLVCGGVHAKYAEQMFPEKAFYAMTLDYKSEVSFHVRQETLGSDALTKIMTLMHVWNATVEYWHEMVAARPSSERGRFFRKFGDHIAFQVSQSIPAGIVKDFGALVKIWRAHDQLKPLGIPSVERIQQYPLEFWEDQQVPNVITLADRRST